MSRYIQRFAANRRGRDFVVGDIHGCFYMLDALLERLEFDVAGDRLFSVGDLIDRGPDSERAAEFLDYDWFHAIRGNHEQMLLDGMAYGGQDAALWQMNGGDWFAGVSEADAEALRERIQALPHAIEVELDTPAGTGEAALVHAQMPSMAWPRLVDALAATPTDALLATLLWRRDSATEVERRGRKSGRWFGGEPRAVAVEGVDVIFFGHTPMPLPIAADNTRWLDTGAFLGRSLSVAELAVNGQVWALHADLERLEPGWTRRDARRR